VRELTPAARVREALASTGRGPSRSLSQHFLTDPNILRHIVAAAELSQGTRVLEIGPGPGTLTAELLLAGACVVAVELDRALADYLSGAFAGDAVTVVHGDILKVDLDLAAPGGFGHVVANLPYAITSPCLRMLCVRAGSLRRVVLTVQRELAERVRAGPGSRVRGSLGVLVQRSFVVEIVRIVPPTAFIPRPKVDSAVLRLTPVSDPGASRLEDFESVLRAAFGQRRKTLRNALASGAEGWPTECVAAMLAAAGLTGRERAEEVSVHQFEQMCEVMCGLRGVNA